MEHKNQTIFTDTLRINGLQTHLQVGDLIGFSRTGTISFSRGHFSIDFSANSPSAVVEGMNESSFEMIIEMMHSKENVTEMFGKGICIKERHRSPEEEIVYFIVTEAPSQ